MPARAPLAARRHKASRRLTTAHAPWPAQAAKLAATPQDTEIHPMPIRSQTAQALLEAAAAKARELGVPVVIAVLDAGGHLKALERMDGAVLGSIDIAMRKARTAVLFQCASEDVWEYCKPGAPAHALELTNGGLAPFGGGLALTAADGTPLGALGVSGGTVEQDLAVARAAHAAVQARLP
jgi:uncharacterized protein GlcG (DUF336 family)